MQKDAYIPVFLAALFTTVKTGNSLNVHRQRNKEAVVYIQWDTIHPQKTMK